MVIYMDQHIDQHNAVNAAPLSRSGLGEYEEEILNASWNPAVAYLFKDVVQCARSPELPEDLTTVDVDSFLDRIYAIATQI
jgi:hypothetical protein